MDLKFLAPFALTTLLACSPASAPPPPAQAPVAPPSNTAESTPSITTTVAAPIAQPLPQGAVWVEAAQKNAEGVSQRYTRGTAHIFEVTAAWREWFRAVRETGVHGAELVAAAEQYRDRSAKTRDVVNAQYKSGAASVDDLLAINADVAEADYWVAWAHNRPENK